MRYMSKKLIKKLNKENRIAFEAIKGRLSSSIIEGNLYKENISEVLNMLLEGQKRNEDYKQVIGEELDEFCNEIIENSYKPNIFEKLYRVIYFFL